MEGYKTLLYSVQDQIATITFNRPKVLNALNWDIFTELQDAVVKADNDDGVKVIVLTGAGEKAFVAGGDLSQMYQLDTIDKARKWIELTHKTAYLLENASKPVIAAVNGFALGGGCEIALACDIRIASEKATFGLPETGLGIIPGCGGTQRLPRIIGRGLAKYYIFTGDKIKAPEALAIGLVEKVVPEDKLMETVQEVANKIVAKGPLAIKMAKLAVNKGVEMELNAGISYEFEAYCLTLCSQEAKEAMQAFLEKRPHSFNSK